MVCGSRSLNSILGSFHWWWKLGLLTFVSNHFIFDTVSTWTWRKWSFSIPNNSSNWFTFVTIIFESISKSVIAWSWSTVSQLVPTSTSRRARVDQTTLNFIKWRLIVSISSWSWTISIWSKSSWFLWKARFLSIIIRHCFWFFVRSRARWCGPYTCIPTLIPTFSINNNSSGSWFI